MMEFLMIMRSQMLVIKKLQVKIVVSVIIAINIYCSDSYIPNHFLRKPFPDFSRSDLTRISISSLIPSVKCCLSNS